MTKNFHKPVLLKEVLHYLSPLAGKIILDATVGGGGHSEAILEAMGGDGKLIALDRDPEAVIYAKERLSRFGRMVEIFKANFSKLDVVLEGLNIKRVDGVLFDLGVSSHQLESEERGFSFRSKALLDMRMDQGEEKTACMLLETLPQEELERIFNEYGEERYARRIAKRIVERREEGNPVRRCDELAELVEEVVPYRARIHPATKVFMALRIYLNRELEFLEQGLKKSVTHLAQGGRLCVISYHSLEDRLVKRFFKDRARERGEEDVDAVEEGVRLSLITRKPVVPGEDEIRMNPRSRGARLRVAERIS